MTCPCGRTEQPSPNATSCYDCGRRVSKPQPVRVAAFDPADYIPETLRPTVVDKPLKGGERAIVDSLFTLLDAMALENAKAKRVRLGFKLYEAVRDANDVSPLEAETSFEVGTIRFVWSSELGEYGCEVSQ